MSTEHLANANKAGCNEALTEFVSFVFENVAHQELARPQQELFNKALPSLSTR